MEHNTENMQKKDEDSKELFVFDDLAKFLEEDETLSEYTKQLKALRKDGVDTIFSCRQEIIEAKKDRMLSEEAKRQRINDNKEQIKKAKIIAAENKNEETRITKLAVAHVNSIASDFEKKVRERENERAVQHKAAYLESIKQIEEEFRQKEQDVREAFSGQLSKESKHEKREELATIVAEKKSALFDAKNKYVSAVWECKNIKHQVYVDRVQQNINLRNSKTNIFENITLSFKDYAFNFTASQFFLSNGLYIAIIIFFIVCIIVAPLSGNGNLLSLPNILTILEQSSVRMFYAIGVAGIILLAGTDLSVGRMVAMGAIITGLILHPGQNIVTFFGFGPWDFTHIAMIWRVLMSLGISIISCVLFSIFAGFFSARLKIHPFISTLATQLMIYGILFFGTSGTPVGPIDNSIKELLGGRWILGVVNGNLITFPKLIIPAIIAIIIAWFIWNKTILGKNMYAVGGNPEAASVSGISVFWVTMYVFIMAGVFYGFGAFFEAFKANASAGTGQGYELDAIAACVVGGISFNGGIGKLEGAVIGVIIFTGLTYCLTFLGIDTNLQFVFKGLIIIAAVALDSVKYLKKR
ncbi:galactoside ABC transporter permease [Treponema phagedenis]|uniref:Galactoside ABC transporter permease n=2 Tax=Treponema phagedenis TaxID=162 RepID=A0A0B7GQ93_TREPH|nr:galactoside ABC transporter permease [Treponema phagedenis]QSH99919.1 galactoside ABC transporter permease [Treponema phagedenis]CEM60764.1 Galactoside transport system permease protein MglC homolog [Treponema phagedenis]